MSTTPKLSDTQFNILATAAQRPGRRILPLPEHLNGSAAARVLDSLAHKNLIEEIEAVPGEPAWTTIEGGPDLTLFATDDAMILLGIDDPPDIDLVAEPGTAPVGGAGTADAEAEAADGEAEADGAAEAEAEADANTEAPAEPDMPDDASSVISVITDLPVSVDTTDASPDDTASDDTPDAPTPDPDAEPRRVRAGTKQAIVVDMLRRPEGATIAELAQATGWKTNTVRGAFAGALKKKLGLTITSEKEGERGRVYRTDPDVVLT